MREWPLVWFSLLAACYDPASETCAVTCLVDDDCPNGLDCNPDRYCTKSAGPCDVQPPDDARFDAAKEDAAISTVCRNFTTPSSYSTGNSYTSIGTVEVWSDSGAILERRNPDPMIRTIPTMGATTYPRLAGASELFAMEGGLLVYSLYDGNGWSPFTPVTTIITNFVPGTVTSSRRMFISKGGTIWEGREQSRDTWSFNDIGTLGMSVALYPSIDPTGTRLVFIGAATQLDPDIYVATRKTPDDPWLPPVLLYDAPNQTIDPFVTADCGALYFTTSSGITRVE